MDRDLRRAGAARELPAGLEVVMRPNGRTGRSGFTLVETMVVVIVMGIVLAVAIPNFARTNRGRQVEAAANDLAARINLERQRTIATRVPHRLVLLPSDHAYRMERLENDSTWIADGESLHVIPTHVSWWFEAGGDDSNEDIEFESRGTVTEEDAPFVITFADAQGDSATVSLVRTGRVTVRRDAP